MPPILLAAEVYDYIQGIITGAAVLVAVWGFRKVLKEIKTENDEEHDRRQKWDKAAEVIEQRAESWDTGLADIDNIRDQMMKRYDGRLDNQDARTQDLFNISMEILRTQDVILEALTEAGIGNGMIKRKRSELNNFIVEQIAK